MHRVRVPRPARGHLAQARLPDLALAHRSGHGADALLDRHAHIAAVHGAEVDDVDVDPTTILTRWAA
ncbi:hypothetical protein SZN_23081 [Streptomyces zinciresistens K42]|uniref:Uncharacterized protein n=1 Tax=Streptomyces zinciresistens K42 TaxID=700597 RepID=G2GGI2_9ACTN|nr:hypothetical protein SZN_23081 [Streptomyces zinciresistens K42]